MNAFSGSMFVALIDLPKNNRSLGKLPGLLLSDVLLIVGLALGLLVVLASIIYLWMKWRRKRRRHVSGGEKVYRGSRGKGELDSSDEDVGEDQPPDDSETDEESELEEDHVHSHHSDDHGKRRYKYRVRRRTHRSRNPTLSETGGLPPVKTNEPSKPV